MPLLILLTESLVMTVSVEGVKSPPGCTEINAAVVSVAFSLSGSRESLVFLPVAFLAFLQCDGVIRTDLLTATMLF